MSIVAIQWEFLQDVAKLILFAQEQGFVLTGGELWRTLEQQQIYIKSGRSKTLKSSHLDRLAIDLNIFKDGKLQTRDQIKLLGDFWENLNPKNRWGGSWRGLVDQGRSTFIDAPHFERQQ